MVVINDEKKYRKTDETVTKPDSILDYNRNMRLVDKRDMQVGSVIISE
jgi:hypothetical protein